ncbi:hypothetical protein CR513_00645 [Mucuna pruriens]|uniref:Granule-bound starch synthase 1, chloroplastic/amyloplastic n=1 Tax=Mucuna pruriens TaxID=157652 RepID=A0A371IH54_MUCPR|nr:hypothetical protein CR513_00645 [Mucuna pruriens]
MATVTGSYAVSRSACHNYNGGGASRFEAKLNSAFISLNRQGLSYDGLRSLNKLHVRRAAITKTNSSTKSNKSGRDRVLRKIECGMNLVFVATEVAPWSKTGGLGDVLGGLPPALVGNGHRVMTVSPRYDQYKDAWDTNVLVEVKIGDKIETVRFFHCYKRGVDRVFVDHPCFLEKVRGKTGSKLYGPRAGEDYEDNQLRFSLLCQAALEAPRVLNLNNSKYFSGPYGEDVVFIANDWHTALLPCYLKSMYQTRGIYKNAKVAFFIHNIAYQGRHGFADFSYLNLPNEFRSSFDFTDGHVKPVRGRKINWMKAAILESDRVFTVSPYYAQELVSGEERGVELDNIIRARGITGIVNGMDTWEWSPKTDKFIDFHYDAATVTEAKSLLKEALQAEVGLPVDRNIPLIGFIGRLEEQKGSDILVEAIPKFIDQNVQIVVLGTGKNIMEKQIEQLEDMYPDKAVGIVKFNSPLAHKIIAGADFIVIPSRFEPCGLVQLQAMPYGTVPIVSSTGGLVDTVREGFTGFHTGTFSVKCEAVDPADVEKLATTVNRALGTYGTPVMEDMIQNCMAQDFSWKGPAKQWEKVLLSLEVAGSKPGIDGEEIAPLAKENIATP